MGSVKLKVELDNGNTISSDTTSFSGTLTFTSKEPVKVNKIKYELVMETSKEKDGVKTLKKKTLGAKEEEVQLEIDPNNPTIYKFDTGEFFDMAITSNQDLEDMGGALKLLGKVGKALDKETVTYTLKVFADVENLTVGVLDLVELKYIKGK
ncbi:MAG: hypothetical protein KatS3mg085_419 [Candidatus Dojkabacteria bacterium]|nr:MAG: hypothetical protein KatS3mg085_419 [Candidatus Dojkabacteria bacterium]